ncbi:unnamed protein product [Jaminaea pallidilutea]
MASIGAASSNPEPPNPTIFHGGRPLSREECRVNNDDHHCPPRERSRRTGLPWPRKRPTAGHGGLSFKRASTKESNESTGRLLTRRVDYRYEVEKSRRPPGVRSDVLHSLRSKFSFGSRDRSDGMDQTSSVHDDRSSKRLAVGTFGSMFGSVFGDANGGRGNLFGKALLEQHQARTLAGAPDLNVYLDPAYGLPDQSVDRANIQQRNAYERERAAALARAHLRPRRHTVADISQSSSDDVDSSNDTSGSHVKRKRTDSIALHPQHQALQACPVEGQEIDERLLANVEGLAFTREPSSTAHTTSHSRRGRSSTHASIQSTPPTVRKNSSHVSPHCRDWLRQAAYPTRTHPVDEPSTLSDIATGTEETPSFTLLEEGVRTSEHPDISTHLHCALRPGLSPSQVPTLYVDGPSSPAPFSPLVHDINPEQASPPTPGRACTPSARPSNSATRRYCSRERCCDEDDARLGPFGLDATWSDASTEYGQEEGDLACDTSFIADNEDEGDDEAGLASPMKLPENVKRPPLQRRDASDDAGLLLLSEAAAAQSGAAESRQSDYLNSIDESQEASALSCAKSPVSDSFTSAASFDHPQRSSSSSCKVLLSRSETSDKCDDSFESQAVPLFRLYQQCLSPEGSTDSDAPDVSLEETSSPLQRHSHPTSSNLQKLLQSSMHRKVAGCSRLPPSGSSSSPRSFLDSEAAGKNSLRVITSRMTLSSGGGGGESLRRFQSSLSVLRMAVRSPCKEEGKRRAAQFQTPEQHQVHSTPRAGMPLRAKQLVESDATTEAQLRTVLQLGPSKRSSFPTLNLFRLRRGTVTADPRSPSPQPRISPPPLLDIEIRPVSPILKHVTSDVSMHTAPPLTPQPSHSALQQQQAQGELAGNGLSDTGGFAMLQVPNAAQETFASRGQVRRYDSDTSMRDASA